MELRTAGGEGVEPAIGGNELVLRTSAQVVRRGTDGQIDVVAQGEAEETWLYDRAGATIVPYRVIDGSRIDAPFRFAVDERSLVMQSDQPALKDWRFIR